MKTKLKVDLGDVQKTLFMPVWARAVESQKHNAILIDKTAIEIINSVDYDFEKMSANISEISQVAWIARCKRFDIVIDTFIKNYPQASIVNIGCGLDTMYERINNPSVHWYDLDLLDVIDLRNKFLCESENRKFIAGSLLDTSWFNLINKENVMFVLKGVLVYFNEDEVKNFLTGIVGSFPGAELFFDVTSPKGVKIANDVILKSGLNKKSFFKWGIKNKNEFAVWDKRLQLINTYYTYKIKGLHLSFKDRIVGFISDFMDIQYMVHLRILNDHE
ncbi:MAG: class I SAM-dependent methyltransferase [Ignavibacteria bacterium]